MVIVSESQVLPSLPRSQHYGNSEPDPSDHEPRTANPPGNTANPPGKQDRSPGKRGDRLVRWRPPRTIRSYDFDLLATRDGRRERARPLLAPQDLSEIQREILKILVASWEQAHKEHGPEITARFGVREKVRCWDGWHYGPTLRELIKALELQKIFPTKEAIIEIHNILYWMKRWGLVRGIGSYQPRSLRPGPRITGELIPISERAGKRARVKKDISA